MSVLYFLLSLVLIIFVDIFRYQCWAAGLGALTGLHLPTVAGYIPRKVNVNYDKLKSVMCGKTLFFQYLDIVELIF